MNPFRADRYDLAWSRGDLARLIWPCILAGAALIHAGWPQHLWFGSEPPIDSGRIALAAEKIDPNTATAASLRRLGGIGPVKAHAIVQYRQPPGFCPVHGHRLRHRFLRPDDLANVHGIGPKIVGRIKPHLAFPKRQE